MSLSTVLDKGDYDIIHLTICKVGKLGIEFRSTSSPYFVINVSAEAQELYDVHPGDLLVSVKKDTDTSWTNAEGLVWSRLVDILKHRPAMAEFKRFKPVAPQPVSPVRAPTPAAAPVPTLPDPKLTTLVDPLVVGTGSPREVARSPFVRKDIADKSPAAVVAKSPMVAPQSPLVVPPVKPAEPVSPPLPSNSTSVPVPSIERRVSRQRSDPSLLTVVYSSVGPLGLEFEDMDVPFRVGSVKAQSMSAEKGVRRGDRLILVNGKSTEGLTWDEIRSDLSLRPAIAVFKRSDEQSPEHKSVWDIAAGLVRGADDNREHMELMRERDELRNIIRSLTDGNEIERLRKKTCEFDDIKSRLDAAESSAAQLASEKSQLEVLIDEERAKNMKLIEVIDEIEKGQATIIDRFEKEIAERDKQLSELKQAGAASASSPRSSWAVETLKESINQYETRIQLMEKDNTRLRKENTDLGVMVQQCLEKIHKDLSDKPHWVDRRIVCAAITNLLKETDSIDNRLATAVDLHASVRQRLGDVLGLTHEERASMGLFHAPSRTSNSGDGDLRGHSIGEVFVTFLEREAGVLSHGSQQLEFAADEVLDAKIDNDSNDKESI